MAESEPEPVRRLHGATQVRWARPTRHDPALSRLVTGYGFDRGGPIEHEQRRTALPCACGELPGVAGSYRGARRKTDEIDSLEQSRNNALPATFRAGARDEDEMAEISPKLGCCDKSERWQADHGAPVPPRRCSGEQGEQKAGRSRCPVCCGWCGGCAHSRFRRRPHRRPEQDRPTSREPAIGEEPSQLRKDRENPLGRRQLRGRTAARGDEGRPWRGARQLVGRPGVTVPRLER